MLTHCGVRALAHPATCLLTLRLTHHSVSLQAVLEDQSQMRQMELEIRPLFLVPDTNGFIDHLASLARLLESRKYILVVPLIGESGQSSLARAQQPPLCTCLQPKG